MLLIKESLSQISNGFVEMEQMIVRDNLIKIGKAPAKSLHEVVFAVKKNNIDILEKAVLERSSPSHQLYQKWLNFDDVTDIISNKAGSTALESWLSLHNITITWKSVRSDYFKASAPVEVWETLFNTTFYLWEDHALEGIVTNHTLSMTYSLPIFLHLHISAVFYTCQSPPVISKHYVRKGKDKNFKSTFVFDENKDRLRRSRGLTDSCVNSGQNVNVAFLNCFYKISSNMGT